MKKFAFSSVRPVIQRWGVRGEGLVSGCRERQWPDWTGERFPIEGTAEYEEMTAECRRPVEWRCARTAPETEVREDSA